MTSFRLPELQSLTGKMLMTRGEEKFKKMNKGA